MTFLEYIAKAMADWISAKETFYGLPFTSMDIVPARARGAAVIHIHLDPVTRDAVCEELDSTDVTAYIGVMWITDGFRVVARVGALWQHCRNIHFSEGSFSLPKDLRLKLKLTKNVVPPDGVYDQVGTWMLEEGII